MSSPSSFGCEAANAFAVHRELGGASGGDDGGDAILFNCGECISGDGFDFGYHEVGILGFDHSAEGVAVEHGDNM